MLKQANSIIKYMPIDKSAMSIMNPLIDLTGHHNTNFDRYGDAPAQEFLYAFYVLVEKLLSVLLVKPKKMGRF